MLAVQVTRLGLSYVKHTVCFEPQSNIAMTLLRKDMFDMVQSQDYLFLNKFPTGNLMTRLTQDLDRVRHTVAYIVYATVDAATLFIFSLGFLLYINWQLALCLLAISPLILLVSWRFRKNIRPRFVLLRQKLTGLGTVVTENIDGNRVVKAFAKENHEISNFEKHNTDFRDTSYENALVAAKYQPVMDLMSNIVVVVTLLAGGIFLIRESITPGEYLAFSSLTWTMSGPFRMLAMILADIERFNATATMIREVIEAPQGIHDKPEAIDLPENPSGGIEFRNVNFSIDGKSILEDISFKVNPGETLGVLGSTGSGKTIMVNLLARFYEPDSGEVLLDGKNVQSYTLSSLRRSIGLAMQDVFLFSDSIKGNIAYGRPDLDEDSIVKRAVQSDVDDFVRQMEDGYETLVGERGVGLSGGQRQRIALARALAVKPAVLILDDTTSSVDSETELYIQEHLRNLDFPCTKIIIAQRISSFRRADCILVMDKGRIIERGKHEELVAMKGFYHNIWNLQYGSIAEKK
jgi:ATP-binding cassette subfamily B protein